MASNQVDAFQLATGECAIPIFQVKEFTRYDKTTKLSNIPKDMEQSIALRDKITDSE